eukprot:GILK01006075.1.p1 GENE.GILK01006075.1~~GILK01006075.1.p1  ORF type:complete len:575 (+),score=97.51 GILK01006075.1:107-1831(+)
MTDFINADTPFYAICSNVDAFAHLTENELKGAIDGLAGILAKPNNTSIDTDEAENGRVEQIYLADPKIDNIDQLVQKIYQHTVAKQGSSFAIGKNGAEHVKQLLTKAQIGFEDMQGRAHMGDLHLTIPGFESFTGMLETKDWAQSVSTAEVEKFHRDIKTANDAGRCDFAALISLRSSIAKRSGIVSFDIHTLPSGKPIPVAYIASSQEQLIAATIKMLAQVVVTLNDLGHEQCVNVFAILDSVKVTLTQTATAQAKLVKSQQKLTQQMEETLTQTPLTIINKAMQQIHKRINSDQLLSVSRSRSQPPAVEARTDSTSTVTVDNVTVSETSTFSLSVPSSTVTETEQTFVHGEVAAVVADQVLPVSVSESSMAIDTSVYREPREVDTTIVNKKKQQQKRKAPEQKVDDQAGSDLIPLPPREHGVTVIQSASVEELIQLIQQAADHSQAVQEGQNRIVYRFHHDQIELDLNTRTVKMYNHFIKAAPSRRFYSQEITDIFCPEEVPEEVRKSGYKTYSAVPKTGALQPAGGGQKFVEFHLGPKIVENVVKIVSRWEDKSYGNQAATLSDGKIRRKK